MRTKALYILTLLMPSFLGMNAQDFILSTGGELKAFHNYELKEAIDAANPNDTIFLGPGSYSLEGLPNYDNGKINVPMLTKPLVFIGAGSNQEPYDNLTFIWGDLMLKPEPGVTGNYVFEGVALSNLYMDSSDCPVTLTNVIPCDITVLGKSDSLTLESIGMLGARLNVGDGLLSNLNVTNSIFTILQGQCDLSAVFTNCNIYEVYMPAEFINSIVNSLNCSGSNLVDSYYCIINEGISMSGNGKKLAGYDIMDFIQDPDLAGKLGMIGNDGTPVGISGGVNPYSDNPPYPAPNTFYSDATYNVDAKSMDVSVKILAYNGKTGKDSPDRTASGYRHVVNGNVVGTGSIAAGTSEFSLQMPVDDDVKVTDVGSREFSMAGNEVTGKYHGYALYNFQMISPSDEWGSLLSKYFEKDYIFTFTPADVKIGETYNHAKVTECGAFAIKYNSNGYLSTVKADQDCEMQILAFVDDKFVNYGTYGADQLKEGLEIYAPAETVAVFYKTPIDSSNSSSDINIIVSYSSQNVTYAPALNFDWETNKMTMASDQSDATIYYTLDGSTPTHESNVYTGPIAIEHNLTVNAIAWSEAGGDSEMASMTIDSFNVPEPQINREGNTYAITNTLEGVTTKYTLDGTDPKSSGTAEEYVAPLTIMEECTLAAYSYKEYFNDSPIVYYQIYPETDPNDPENPDPENPDPDNPITPDEPEKCPKPYVEAYDGHYLTLACSDTDATIYYTNGQGQNLVYDSPIELENINGISYYAEDEAKYKAPSDQVYYEPEYYSNSDMIQVRKPGLLKKSVEWQPGVDFENLKVETFNENWLPFAIDDDDFAFLRSLKSVKDLDLSQTGNKSLPTEAFANMGVKSLVLPSTLTTFGKNIFSGCDRLCSLEILADVTLPADIFESKAENPNMLLYVANRDNVSQLKEGTFGLIWKYGDSYRTEKLELHDGYPYYNHAQYFAKEISYSRVFEKSTPLGGCAGWEGICLPFNVENISYGDKNLMPFGYGAEDGTLNYWLYSYDQNVWQSAGGLYQDMAFIISMPNNDSYLPEFNISGTVTFTAYNQYVYSSRFDPNSSSQLKANFELMEVSNDVMVLNDDTYYADGKTFEPGSVFVAGLRAPRPFESYIDNVYGTRYMKVGGTTGLEEMAMMQGFNAWTEGNEICISSSMPANVKIFNTTGQLVRTVTVTPGNVSRVGGIPTGIYITGNKKLYLKR